jgi:AraC-like DNA-binding protein
MLPPRKVIGWVVFAFVLILAAYLPHCIFENPLSEYLKFGDQSTVNNKSLSTMNSQQLEEIRQAILHYNQTLLTLNNLLNLLIVFLHICLTLYYIHKLHVINYMDKSSAVAAPPPDSNNKYDTLYQCIVDFMEKDKPFCAPNFNISLLATATNSNANYVSNAIHEKTGMHFAAFINSYRVEFAKKELQHANAKYTIEHLSLSAGFNHQTTFNRVFKAIEGKTPTEYMNLHQKVN